MRQNPVYSREMKVSARSPRFPLILSLFIGILCLAALINMYSVVLRVRTNATIQYSSFMDIYEFVTAIEFIQMCIRDRGMSINKDNHKVVVDGEEIKLTPIEFDILYLLASNPGKVFSTDEIFERVWNEKVYEANNTVMVHIRRLRGKMKEDTRQSKIITTVWGVGYKIEK